MEFMSEEEISFINCFSNSNICTNQFFKEKKLPKNNKFLMMTLEANILEI